MSNMTKLLLIFSEEYMYTLPVFIVKITGLKLNLSSKFQIEQCFVWNHNFYWSICDTIQMLFYKEKLPEI